MGRTRWIGIVVLCVLRLQPPYAAPTFDETASAVRFVDRLDYQFSEVAMVAPNYF